MTKLISVLLCLVFSSAVWAQAYPGKPIRLISPWAPAGPAEALARIVANKVSEAIGQPIVIESRPGANGTIGTGYVAKAAPDGYTVLLSNLGPTAIAPALQKDLPYDSLRDFEPVTQIVAGPTLLVVRNGLPVQNVRELVAYAKANPGKLSYGSVGIASVSHLAGEILNLLTGISTVHIPYKGSTPILTDIMGERVDFAFIGISGSIQQARAGQVRTIAISTLKRSPNFPEIPAVSETAPGFEINSWYGMMMPAGTPRAIVQRLQQEVAAALRKPDVLDWMKQNGLDPVGSTPEEHAAHIRAELVKWARVVQDTKVTAN